MAQVIEASPYRSRFKGRELRDKIRLSIQEPISGGLSPLNEKNYREKVQSCVTPSKLGHDEAEIYVEYD